MADPKLSFCIPTLNRAGFIGATLESIVSQASDQVEIVIVDGGSTDGTTEVVEGFRARFAALRFERASGQEGPSASGYDRDCDRAVALARGEYCWLMADDDVLAPGAVGRVLAELDHGYGLIVVNAEIRGPELREILRERLLATAVDRVYRPADSEALFGDVTSFMSYMGCVVIQRAVWMGRERSPYFGRGFIHVCVVWQRPPDLESLVIADPLVVIRYGNSHWTSGHWFNIMMVVWPKLVWSFPYSETSKRKVCRREPWRELPMLLVARARGLYSVSEYERWIRPAVSSPLAGAVFKLIALLPSALLNTLAWLYFRTLSRRSRLTPFDLSVSPHDPRAVLQRWLSRAPQ